jgi:hypothetical protein
VLCVGDPSYKQFRQEKDYVLDSLKRRARKITDAFNSLEGVVCQETDGNDAGSDDERMMMMMMMEVVMIMMIMMIIVCGAMMMVVVGVMIWIIMMAIVVVDDNCCDEDNYRHHLFLLMVLFLILSNFLTIGAMYSFPMITLPPSFIAEAKRLNKEPDTLYCLELLNETGLSCVPGSGFQQAPGTFHIRTTILVSRLNIR